MFCSEDKQQQTHVELG